MALSDELTRRHRRRNLLQSVALLGGIGGLLALCAWAVAGVEGILWTALGGGLGIALSPRLGPDLMLRLSGARRLARADLPAVYRALDGLARRAGLPVSPRLYYLPTPTLNAFAVGRRDAPAIAVTDGMLRSLGMRELLGVLGHELSHIRNNDLWVMQLADAMSRLTRLMALAGIALAIVALPLSIVGEGDFPLLLVLLLVVAPTAANLLQLALSRTREYDADLDAAMLTGDPLGLASALGKIERLGPRSWSEVFLPGSRLPEPSLLRSHPPTPERIARLMALGPARGHAADDPVQALPPHLAPIGHRRLWW